MFNRASYISEEKFSLHTTAWARLLQAIDYEEAGDMAKARLSLVIACRDELLALGFESTTKMMMEQIRPWDKPAAKATVH